LSDSSASWLFSIACLPHFENDLPSLVARVATDQTLHERQHMETLVSSSEISPLKHR
jgi:hypothetical protein